MASPGPKREPTALKLLKGNPGKKKLPQNEPKPRPVRPTMPDYLGRDGKRRWNELIADLEAVGVLTVVDGDVLGGYCTAYEAFLRAERGLRRGWVNKTSTGYQAISPFVTIRNRALDDMRKFGAELGIGAASRSRIEVKTPEPDANPLEELLRAAERDKLRRRQG